MERPKWAANYSYILWLLFNCVFGLLMEEIRIAHKCINPTIALFKLQENTENKEYPKYETLTKQEQKKVHKFIAVREEADNFALKLIHLESSIQLVFYLTLLLVNINETPLLEMNYNEQTINLASTKWIIGLFWFLLKTLLSGYNTIAGILRELKKDSYRLTGSAPNVIQFVSLVLSVLGEFMFSAGLTFLLWSSI